MDLKKNGTLMSRFHWNTVYRFDNHFHLKHGITVTKLIHLFAKNVKQTNTDCLYCDESWSSYSIKNILKITARLSLSYKTIILNVFLASSNK